MTDIRNRPGWSDMLDRAQQHSPVTDANREGLFDKELKRVTADRRFARVMAGVWWLCLLGTAAVLAWSIWMGLGPVDIAGWAIERGYITAASLFLSVVLILVHVHTGITWEATESDSYLREKALHAVKPRRASPDELEQIANAVRLSSELAHIIKRWREQLGGELTLREVHVLGSVGWLVTMTESQIGAERRLDDAIDESIGGRVAAREAAVSTGA